jgi:hypothetical protein
MAIEGSTPSPEEIDPGCLEIDLSHEHISQIVSENGTTTFTYNGYEITVGLKDESIPTEITSETAPNTVTITIRPELANEIVKSNHTQSYPIIGYGIHLTVDGEITSAGPGTPTGSNKPAT